MSRSLIFLLKFLSALIFLITIASAIHSQTLKQNNDKAKDTLPDICTVLPAEEIAALMPFTNSLSKSFPEPDPTENYKSCLYQFWKKNDFPGIKVSLLKYNLKEEALIAYKSSMESYQDPQLIGFERLLNLADSVFWGSGSSDPLKCDECGLVAIRGVYQMIIAFKGQFDESLMLRKKAVAIKILEMMLDRIPGLLPSRIHNKL